MNSKKGITPIIAVILLLMMTIAGSAAAFFWFVRMQSELQGGTETFNEDLSAKISSRVDVITIDVGSTDNITLFLKNQGTRTIDLSTETDLTMILKDSDSDVLCSSHLDGDGGLLCLDCTGSLEPKEIQGQISNVARNWFFQQEMKEVGL